MFLKFLLTILVIAVVWFGFKYLQRIAELKERRDRLGPGSPGRPSATAKVQDLVQCPVCATWQSGAVVRPCGRTDCPY